MTLNKRLALRATGVLLAVGLAVPMLAAAQQDRPVRSAGEVKAAVNFCTQLSKRPAAQRFAAQLQQKEQNLARRRTEFQGAVQGTRNGRDAKLDAMRNTQDKKRTEAATRLMGKARNDAQKAAVSAFDAAIAAALTTRREAVNAANAAFRKGLDEARISRKTAVDAAVKTFKEAVTAAEAKAKTDCAADGADAAKIREAMTASISAARRQMQTAVQAAEKVGSQVSDLTKTRNDALRAAQDAFKTAVEKARNDFKAAVVAAAPAETPEGEADSSS
jgi:hypothetical protein